MVELRKRSNESDHYHLPIIRQETVDYVEFMENLPSGPAEERTHIEAKKKGGVMWCKIWTVGTGLSVAYLVECELGSFSDYTHTVDGRVLGIGNADSIRASVDGALRTVITSVAEGFFWWVDFERKSELQFRELDPDFVPFPN